MLDGINRVTGQIVDAAVKLHRDLGPGLLEAVYHRILVLELTKRALSVESQKLVSIEYNGTTLEHGFRVDLLVEGLVVVEVKSVERLADVHPKQVLTYIRLLNLPVGLLLNFGSPLMRDGIVRVVNNYHPYTSARSSAEAESEVQLRGAHASTGRIRTR